MVNRANSHRNDMQSHKSPLRTHNIVVSLNALQFRFLNLNSKSLMHLRIIEGSMSDISCPPFTQSATWIAFLSLIPNNIVQLGATIISVLVVLAQLIGSCRPQSVSARIEKALREVEENIHNAIGCHLLDESSVSGTLDIERRLKR